MKESRAPIIRAFRKDDRDDVAQLVARDDMVLVVDPGACGLACLFPAVHAWAIPAGGWDVTPPAPIAVFPFRAFGGFAELRKAITAAAGGRLLVVIEESFAGGRGNARTDIALARYAGGVIGALSAITMARGFDVVFVLPGAWLSAITGKTGRGTKRDERKAIAKAHAEKNLGVAAVAASAGLSPHREAFCDVYGIATWWGKFARTARPDLYGTR
jgi:hypothetical protein